MKKASFPAAVAPLLVAVLLLAPSRASAQADQHEHGQQAQKGAMKMDGMKMTAKMMDEMAAKKKANTARIDALMAQVRTSTGEVKVAAIADVLAVLLEERVAMQEHCSAMMQMMHK